MDRIFDLCVALLLDTADLLGVTYKEVNVWIFCVFWPIIIVSLCIHNILLAHKIKKLEIELSKNKRKI